MFAQLIIKGRQIVSHIDSNISELYKEIIVSLATKVIRRLGVYFMTKRSAGDPLHVAGREP